MGLKPAKMLYQEQKDHLGKKEKTEGVEKV